VADCDDGWLESKVQELCDNVKREIGEFHEGFDRLRRWSSSFAGSSRGSERPHRAGTH
jgi:hypothetical protein